MSKNKPLTISMIGIGALVAGFSIWQLLAQQPLVQMKDVDPVKAFTTAAHASCDKAMAEGVVETHDNITAVMIPKDQSIDGYSAAYFESPNTYTLIWESDAFSSCFNSMYLTMAEEAGETPTMKVKATSNGFVVDDKGWDGAATKFEYEVKDGVFTKVTNTGAGDTSPVKISYGISSAEQVGIIQKALDAFLAESD